MRRLALWLAFVCIGAGRRSSFIIAVVLFLAVLLGCGRNVFAADALLNWNQNPEPDLMGYKIYYGSASNSYSHAIVVGNVSSYRLSGLVGGQRYFFAVTAYDRDGRESSFSEEAAADIREQSIDSDGDGLSDEYELSIGTDANLADSDSDGITDGQEITDGTNPLDRGSVILRLGRESCAEWNGYLDNLWNILELVNSGRNQLHVRVTLYDIQGQESGSSAVDVAPGTQRDLLIHDNQGRVRDSYGLVCVEHDGGSGDLSGRIVYYRDASGVQNVTSGQFQFAFALPLSGGVRGEQFVSFNTYQPSSYANDALNLVANWMQVTNVGNTVLDGTIVYYNQEGVELGSEAVTINPRQRFDFAAHQFGPSRVGLVRWIPENASIPCIIRNVRYLYDNPWGINSFATAFQLDASSGSGERLAVPVDTKNGEVSVLELNNTAAVRQDVLINFYNESSSSVASGALSLNPYESRHIVVNELLSENQRGLATIKGQIAGGVIATAMQYSRAANGSVNYMYGVPARESQGLMLAGSYNTYLNQGAVLELINTSSEPNNVTLGIIRQDGTEIIRGYQLGISGNTVSAIDINSFEQENEYGVVTIHAEANSSISAIMLRRRNGEYVIPTVVQ